MDTTTRRGIAVGAGVAVGVVRLTAGASIPTSVTDAQGGVWLLSLMLTSGLFAFLVFDSLDRILNCFATQEKFRALGPGLVLSFVSVWYVVSLFGLHDIRTALADAENPDTSPTRLRSLVGYESGFGYEVDNRIAANPNTPPDVLALLSKKDQTGTKMCLARNPNTPDAVLREISKSTVGWVQDALRDNPRYAEVFEEPKDAGP